MSREYLILSSPAMRDRAKALIDEAKDRSRFTLEPPKRTNDQNSLMWELLGQLETKAKYHGLKLSKEDWKILMLSGLRNEMRVVPNLQGNGFVTLDRSSSRLGKAEMGMLIDLISLWASENGVELEHKIPGWDDGEAV